MGNRHILRNDDPSNGIQCKYLECILHGVTHCSIAVRLNAHSSKKLSILRIVDGPSTLRHGGVNIERRIVDVSQVVFGPQKYS